MGKGRTSGKANAIIMNSVRFLLFIAVLIALFDNRRLVLIMGLFGLAVTFVPSAIKRIWRVDLPKDAEVILILFIFGILLMTDITGMFGNFWWWGALISGGTAIALGLVGLTMMNFLNEENKMGASPFLIVFFAFCFAVAFGVLWETFEFFVDTIFAFSLQTSLLDTMTDISSNIAGALLISATGFYYLKTGKKSPVSSFVIKMMEKRPQVFKSKNDPEREVSEMIKKGEHEKLEFKSSMRTNLHTNEVDPRIEHSVMKTVNAYLNSDGGTLLVGVSDNGEILGLDVDKFVNTDRLTLHLTNMIKKHIGNEHLPYIKHSIVPVEGKQVLKIDCQPSDKHVFLRNGNEEEFYVRNGPSSAKLSGSSLIDYVNNKFGKS